MKILMVTLACIMMVVVFISIVFCIMAPFVLL